MSDERTPGPWSVRCTPNGQGGEYVSVVGPVQEHNDCGEKYCESHRPCVAWDIKLADAKAIVGAAAELAALRAVAMRFLYSLDEDEEDHPTLGRVFVSRSDEGAEDALRAALGMVVDD